jgi:cytochrome c oxidase assembly protein subunit 15
MSGTKAGLFYPHFPAFEGAWNGWLPSALLNSAHWSWYHLVHYMEHPFAAALVQVLHRGTAYLLVGLGVYWWYRAGKASLSAPLSQARWALLGVLAGQFLLGVLTVLYCVGKVPVMLGVMHQGGAMMLLAVLLLAYKQMRPVT